MAVAEHDAGQRLHFQVMHRVALLLREIADLRLRELDVVEVALRHLRDGLLDLGRRQLEVGRRPFVELLRQFADGGVLAFLDRGQDLLDRLAHLGVGGLDRACIHSAFEPAGHGVSSFLSLAPRSGERVARFERSSMRVG